MDMLVYTGTWSPCIHQHVMDEIIDDQHCHVIMTRVVKHVCMHMWYIHIKRVICGANTYGAPTDIYMAATL